MSKYSIIQIDNLQGGICMSRLEKFIQEAKEFEEKDITASNPEFIAWNNSLIRFMKYLLIFLMKKKLRAPKRYLLYMVVMILKNTSYHAFFMNKD